MSEYIEKNLVKVITYDNKTIYYAVNDKTYDGMLIAEGSLSYCNDRTLQFKMEYLGTILVQQDP